MSEMHPNRGPFSGFVLALFDLSFSEFISAKFTRFLYTSQLIVIGLVSAAIVLWPIFNDGSGGDLIRNVFLAVVFFFVAAILARIYAEATIAFFRIAETTSHTAAEAAAIRELVANGRLPATGAIYGDETGATARCEHCGAGLVAGNAFCTGCGQPVER